MTTFLFANGPAKGHSLTSIHRVKCKFKIMSEQFAGCFPIIWQRTHGDFLYYFIFLWHFMCCQFWRITCL